MIIPEVSSYTPSQQVLWYVDTIKSESFPNATVAVTYQTLFTGKTKINELRHPI